MLFYHNEILLSLVYLLFYYKTKTSVVTSTSGNVSTHGNSTSCSKTEKIAPPANSERIKG